MYFNLEIISAGDSIKLSDHSGLVKFFIEAKLTRNILENFSGTLNITLNKIQEKYFLGKKGDEIIHYTEKSEPSVIFLKKVKLDEDFTVDFFRNYFAGLVPTLLKKEIKTIDVIVPLYEDYKKYFSSEEYFLQSMIEGIMLGNYTFDKYKSEKEEGGNLKFILHYSDKNLLQSVISNTKKIVESVYFTRDLVNEPAVTLTPMELGLRVKDELTQHGVKIQIFDHKELKRRNMNAILAVGGSSTKSPCMIIAHYKPKQKSVKKIALVGKGVTYDSGGLSIKPTSGMIDMKADMAGGAAVFGIIRAAALLKLPLDIIGIVPAVENMLAGNSFKPGDIIKSYSGKTIEIKDTDAEGRLILADALHYASQQKPDEIIDMATLTGACMVALGVFTAGLFTSYDQLADNIIKSAEKTYEKVWRLPFWKEYNSLIKSEIADISNLGPRWGGAITAGKFLEHFVDKKIPWVHLDIAGPAIKHEFTNYTKKYDTGFGVRLLIDYLISSTQN